VLLVTAAIWGFAFVAQRIGMDHVGPFLFNGIRFALGSLALVPVWLVRRRRDGLGTRTAGPFPEVLRAGLTAGLVLFCGASLQQVGLVYTTAGKAGFITGLYVVLVPVLGKFFRHRIGAGGWTGALLAATGLYLLSVTEGFRIDPGDSLIVGSAFFWAAHVLMIGRWARRFDVFELAAIQFATCSALSLAAAALVETNTLSGVVDATVPILYSGILSVGVGYTLQVVAQRRVQPTTAAILMSLEAVFAAAGGWLVLGETLSLRGILGCACMLAGVLASQLWRRSAAEEPVMETRVT
jgi:drug/metabolite transporter (DMT)-like permease